MKTSHFILFWVLLSLFSSCNEPKDRVRIVGEISGIKMADFYVYNEEELLGDVDTVKIVAGEFSYERKLSHPVVLTFLYPNFSRTYVIAEPGKKIKVKGEASKLSGLDVSGTKDNELLTKFKLQHQKSSIKDIQMAAAQFVRDHPESMAAVAVFKKYFVQAENRNATVALPLLDELKRAQANNPSVQMMENRLRDEMRTAVGMNLPDFTTVDIKGDTIQSADYKGKPLLVLFWAPWNNECYRFMKNVARIENKYLAKLNILLVSVDYDKKLSKIRAGQENIASPVICEGHGFASPIVRTLGARYVTGNLFVNADGEIVKRDVPNDKLFDEVKNWME